MGCDEVIDVFSTESHLPNLLLDTHVLLWLIGGNRLLGPRSVAQIDVGSSQGKLVVSAITPWEVSMLASKGRITFHRDASEWVVAALAYTGMRLIPLSPEVAVRSNELPFAMHGDAADRILVATARHLGATLVTADQALLQLARNGHFAALDASV